MSSLFIAATVSRIERLIDDEIGNIIFIKTQEQKNWFIKGCLTENPNLANLRECKKYIFSGEFFHVPDTRIEVLDIQDKVSGESLQAISQKVNSPIMALLLRGYSDFKSDFGLYKGQMSIDLSINIDQVQYHLMFLDSDLTEKSMIHRQIGKDFVAYGRVIQPQKPEFEIIGYNSYET